MADFSFLSDTDESEAIEQILAEAMDHCVLQQVAAINCSSFSNSSLPSHLESRFQRLKTFPSTKPQLGHNSVPNSATEFINSVKQSPTKNPHHKMDFSSESSNSSSSSPNFNPKKGKNKGKDENFTSNKGKGENFEGKNDEFISNKGKDENFTSKNGKGENFGGKNDEFISKTGKDGNFLSRSPSIGSDSSDGSTKTVKSGCFWCSPKKKKNSNKKESSGIRTRLVELDEWGKHDEILSDLKSFSEKKQKKLMQLAKKEEEKINKEAEKIVKWAKQASSRMEFDDDDDDDDDDVSDDDYDHGHNFGHH